ncbi:MAG TPA: TetR/AcrR family transcriptional regulator [Mycobacterium sp.]|uniref:TetR/AcrR family transcriptional regulator n=1 Tax=Rhodococcus erythropolis TaxID=1833 RepID=UPI0024B83F8C|nr:TetR/AcrR family transcriptional regulator [Rhodococcus erythropolis]MDJ0015508.1 TetR/AcrR family transcriptional regulator [Rhodococcus erythropolis]
MTEHASGNETKTETKRPRGRPRADIDPGALADAVADLFAAGGEDAVTIPDAAEKLGVSRATLYRTVPTREHLMGVLFERSTRELTDDALRIIDEVDGPGDQLSRLVDLLTRAAVRMRRYMPVFFGGGDLPSDVVARWRGFAHNFEDLWVHVVKRAMDAGELAVADPVITTRLLIGQCLWVSRWYRPSEPYDVDQIANAAVQLLPITQTSKS